MPRSARGAGSRPRSSRRRNWPVVWRQQAQWRRVGPTDRARNGSDPVMSSQRPSQPMPGSPDSWAVCQINCGLEVAEVGVGVLDAVDDGDLAGFPQGVQRGQRGVEAEVSRPVMAERQDLVARDGKFSAPVAVDPALVGDHRVEPVVAAVEGAQHERAVFRRLLRRTPQPFATASPGR